jgi:hypothetical protein
VQCSSCQCSTAQASTAGMSGSNASSCATWLACLLLLHACFSCMPAALACLLLLHACFSRMPAALACLLLSHACCSCMPAAHACLLLLHACCSCMPAAFACLLLLHACCSAVYFGPWSEGICVFCFALHHGVMQSACCQVAVDVLGVIVALGTVGTVKRKADASELFRRDVSITDQRCVSG